LIRLNRTSAQVLRALRRTDILWRVRVDDIFRAIGRFSVKFRWLVVVVWLAGTVAAVHGLPSLSSVTQGNNTAFLPASAPSEQASNLAAPFGTTNLVPVPVVAAVPSGTLTAADQAWLTRLTADLGKVATVVKARELGVSTPSAATPGQAAQVQVLSNAAQGDQTALTSLVANLRAAITKSSPPPGIQVHLAGQAAITVDQQKQSGTTGNAVQGASFIFILILLMIIFRAVLAPFITLVPAALSVTIAGPIVGELGHHGLKVSSLAQLLMIVLVLGAGTDYGLFLVFRVRENLRAGQDNKEAVVSALTKVGESITFSALTVIAALLSLLFATFQIYSTLGIPLAIGIGVMLLAGLTLLPALLAIFGRAAFWPTKNRAGAVTTGVWGRISARLVRRPAIALTIGVVVFGALSGAATAYVSGGFGGSLSAPSGTDSAAGTNLLAKYFPATAANPTNLVYKLSAPAWEDPSAIAVATTQLERSGLFTGVTGPLNPVGGNGFTPAQYQRVHAALGTLGAASLPAAEPAALAGKVSTKAYQMYRASAQFVAPAGTTIQFQTGLKAGDPSSTAAMNAVPAIRNEAATTAKTLHATASGVAGEAPAFYDIGTISNSDLAHVIPIAIVVIGVLLALVMRSLVAPLYLIASVALSYFAALGLAVLVFIEIGHGSGITFILPFLLFIFLLALGEDYNILVMTRIREEAHRYSLREAVSRAVGVTGTTVTSAGLVLAGTFAVFAIFGASGSGGSMIREVGFGLAAGVLMDTFVVRTVLVPCTAVLLGRWNWWPSRLGTDVSVSEAVTADADSLGLASPASSPASEADAGEGPKRRS
jgi:putative drug exporter of the RND superfamily